MKHLGPYLLASVWICAIAALAIAGKDDAAGVFSIAGIFASILVAAARS